MSQISKYIENQTPIKSKFMTKEQRFTKLVEQLGGNSEVANSTGISSGAISNVTGGRNKLGITILEKLMNSPLGGKVSCRWILTGEGNYSTKISTSQVAESECSSYKESEMDKLLEELSRKNEHIKRLTNIIENLSEGKHKGGADDTA